MMAWQEFYGPVNSETISDSRATAAGYNGSLRLHVHRIYTD